MVTADRVTEQGGIAGESSKVGAQADANARIISFGGGKGGVGKTFLAANVAVALAKLGYRVLAADTDLEAANLHTCLGLSSPPVSLADFVSERQEDLGKLVLDTPVENLQVIAGTHANLGSPQPSHSRQVRLMRALRRQPVDFVLLDLGAGSHTSVLDYFLMGDDALVVVQPEPTSVENAYTFLRAAFYRRMRLAMMGHGVRKLVTQAMDHRNERGIRTPIDLLREIEALDPAEGARFVATMREFKPRIVINGVRTAEDIKLGFAICSVCRKYFGVEADYLGYVNHDEAARQSVAARKPVVDYRSNSDAAVYLQRIAHKLVQSKGTEGPAGAGSARR